MHGSCPRHAGSPCRAREGQAGSSPPQLYSPLHCEGRRVREGGMDGRPWSHTPVLGRADCPGLQGGRPGDRSRRRTDSSGL